MQCPTQLPNRVVGGGGCASRATCRPAWCPGLMKRKWLQAAATPPDHSMGPQGYPWITLTLSTRAMQPVPLHQSKMAFFEGQRVSVCHVLIVEHLDLLNKDAIIHLCAWFTTDNTHFCVHILTLLHSINVCYTCPMQIPCRPQPFTLFDFHLLIPPPLIKPAPNSIPQLTTNPIYWKCPKTYIQWSPEQTMIKGI